MVFPQSGLSGNMVVLTVFYYGGILMNDSLITVGQLSSFMLYAAYVGVSINGELQLLLVYLVSNGWKGRFQYYTFKHFRA